MLDSIMHCIIRIEGNQTNWHDSCICISVMCSINIEVGYEAGCPNTDVGRDGKACCGW